MDSPDEPLKNILDNPAITIRRKRRNSSFAGPSSDAAEPDSGNGIDQPELGEPSTPRRAPKRVRFSDPGPERAASSESESATAAASSGLTPAISRYSIVDQRSPPPSSPSLLQKAPRRPLRTRHSLPSILKSTGYADNVFLQFAPLRQVLDGRVQRRLRRNHLSEETNEIENQKKDEAKLKKSQIELLKREVEEKDAKVEELKEALKAAAENNKADRALQQHTADQEAQGELTRLQWEAASSREEISQMEQDDRGLSQDNDSRSSSGAVQPRQKDDVMTTISDEFGVDMSDVGESSFFRPASPVSSVTLDASDTNAGEKIPSTTVNFELRVAELEASLRSLTADLEKTATVHQRVLGKLSAHSPDSVSQSQDDSTTLDASLDNVLTSLVLAQSRAEDTTASLATLSNEITALGFPASSALEMLEQISTHFREARLELEYLQPGENVAGFANANLLSMLLDRIRALMTTVQDGMEDLEGLRRREEIALEQAHAARGAEQAAEKRAEFLKINLSRVKVKQLDAEDRARALQTEAEELARSNEKLKSALDGYRAEVHGLEQLVTRIEGEHENALAAVRADMDEAVADLEEKCTREAEDKEDAQCLLAEKQGMIAELEDQARSAVRLADEVGEHMHVLLREKELCIGALRAEAVEAQALHAGDVAERDALVNRLRGEIAGLDRRLEEARGQVQGLLRDKGVLEGRVRMENEAGRRAVEAVRGEMVAMVERVGDVVDRYKGGEQLPKTPQGTKFRGGIGTPATSRERGGRKRKWDSGFGVLEEEEELELGDVDVDFRCSFD